MVDFNAAANLEYREGLTGSMPLILILPIMLYGDTVETII